MGEVFCLGCLRSLAHVACTFSFCSFIVPIRVSGGVDVDVAGCGRVYSSLT